MWGGRGGDKEEVHSPVDGVLVPLVDVGDAGGAGHHGVVGRVVGVGVVHGGHAGREQVREGVRRWPGHTRRRWLSHLLIVISCISTSVCLR